MKPMKLASEELSSIDSYIEDKNWVLEQKMDGARGLLHVTPRQAIWHSGAGKELKFAAATKVTDKLGPAIQRALSDAYGEFDIYLDGEVMIDSGEYRVFDAPFIRVGNRQYTDFKDLYDWRSSFFLNVEAFLPEQVTAVFSARTAAEKRSLFEQVTEIGGEGVVAKRLDGDYQPGRRPKHSRKLKFVKTADVFITAMERGRNDEGREIGHADFAVNDELGVRHMGSCSLIGKPGVSIGDVIEVKYLYVGTGGKLIQPRLFRMRDDRTPDSCQQDQFAEYSREAVGE